MRTAIESKKANASQQLTTMTAFVRVVQAVRMLVANAGPGDALVGAAAELVAPAGVHS